MMRLSILLLLLHACAFAEDSVDSLEKKYNALETRGLKTLHLKHREDLVKVLNTAMDLKNLDLANKAKTKIGELDEKIVAFGGDQDGQSKSGTNQFP
ncbi:hypothetical protein [Luteolibacter sp. AS25]|uniref:hypothetical protein n=1 Tax=Luteolibacter sp. AS25 TaxID=3135776 RepID=UPI00398AD74B